MAYVVGSVSVEVVPDFRNAQNAITAFFNSQPDTLKAPVKPDLDRSAVQQVEREAAQVGSRVGEALSQNVSRSINRNLVGDLTRQISRLEADIAKARRDSDAATKALRVAELRLDEARRAGNRSASTMLSLEQAVEKQRGKLANADRVVAEGAARLVALRQQLADATAQAAEDAAQRAIEAQQRADRAAIESAHATAIRMNAEFDRRAAAAKRLADKQISEEKRTADRSLREAERRAAAELKILERTIDQENRLSERAAKDRERRAVAEAKAATRAAAAAARESAKVQIQVEVDERKALQAGRRTGGLVARAMREELHQSAGLIAAVIGGILIAGAPVALAGATALFGAIGAVAAAQSQRVRSAWVGAWGEIKTGAIEDAAVLVPTFERMSVQISQSFQRLRPAMREAFEAVGPQLESITASLVTMGETAVPALVRAVQAGNPVVHGFGVLLEGAGTGLADFFDTLTAHAPAAGDVFSDLGESLAILLPTLAELIGQGAELASVVLPALNGSLSGLLTVVTAIGPALPAIGAGFLAFRAAQGAGRYIENLGIKLSLAAQQGGIFAGIQGRVGSALSRVGGALPAIGLAVGAVSAVMAEASQVTDDWRNALLEGGRAAQTAGAQMQAVSDFWTGDSLGLLGDFVRQYEFLADALGLGADAADDAHDAYLDYLDSLSPVAEAQVLVNKATNDMALALEDSDAVFGGVEGASRRLAAAQSNLRRLQDELAEATYGVTQAMVDQGEAARSLADSSFAHEQALIDLAEAQADYKAVMEDTEATELDRRQALLDLQTAYQDVADTARDMALDALPVLLDESQKQIIADKAQLDALLALKEQYGDLGPVLENQILTLQASTSAADGNKLAQAELAAALAQVGITASAIPDSKSVKVFALTDEARTRLEDLGLTVTENVQDGSFTITAETDEAQGNLDKIDTTLAGIDGQTARTDIELDAIPFFDGADAVLDEILNLDSQEPTPEADLDPTRFDATWQEIMGLSDDLDSQRPTPVAGLTDRATPFINGIIERAVTLGQQRPTPVASAVDNATPTISGILQQLGLLTDREVIITTRYREIRETVLSNIPLFGGAAEGGAPLDLRAMPRFDFGGSLPRIFGEVYGRGGPKDDLVPARLSPTEHVLDSGDVARMGGQAGVYAFREMLSSGKLGPSFDVRRAAGSAGRQQSPESGIRREVSLYTPDIPSAIRALRADEHQQAVLAPVW